MLVIFAYFAAITPNQHLYISQLALVTLVPAILWALFILIQPLHLSFSATTLNPNIPITILFNNLPLTLLAIILFLTLVAVTKISFFNMGPLRPFLSYVSALTKITPSN